MRIAKVIITQKKSKKYRVEAERVMETSSKLLLHFRTSDKRLDDLLTMAESILRTSHIVLVEKSRSKEKDNLGLERNDPEQITVEPEHKKRHVVMIAEE